MAKKGAANNKKVQKPKLKPILLQPKALKCPSLTKDEFLEVANLLSSALKESGMPANAFIKESRISLGLASTLRAINKCQCSCVLISLSLRPHHLISLIARNLEVKDNTVPIFAQTDLSVVTEQVFGQQALAMAIPKHLGPLKSHLENWINSHKKEAKIAIKPVQTETKKRCIKLDQHNRQAKTEVKKQEVVQKPIQADKAKFASTDFLSFSDASLNIRTDAIDVEKDTDQLCSVLKKLSRKAEEKQIEEPTTSIVAAKSQCDATKMKFMPNFCYRSGSEDSLYKYEVAKIIKLRSKQMKKSKNKKRK